VRARTLAAFDTVGPPSDIPFERRALIVDYLAGQLPLRVAEEIRGHVSESASERAWVAAVTSELAPALSPAISDLPKPASTRPTTATQQAPHTPVAAPAIPTEATPPTVEEPVFASTRRRAPRLSTPVLATSTVAILAIGAVIVLLSSAGASPKHASLRTTGRASAAGSSTSSTAASTSTSTTKTSVHVLAHLKLASATPASKVTGIAEVLQDGSTKGLAIGARNVPPNTTHPPNAYAVWLYNSPTDARILGFVSPGVGKNGRLTTAGALPSDAGLYRTLIVTLETNGNPKTPGTIILRGTLAGL
jgi:hypothetical protein